MKAWQKRAIFTTSLLSTFTAVSIPAYAAAHATTIPRAIRQAETGYFVGFGGLQQDYPDIGSLPALTVGVTGINAGPQAGFYWRATYTRASGNTSYSYSSNGTSTQTTIANTINEISGRLGGAFGYGRTGLLPATLIPYLGFGVHRWTGDITNGVGVTSARYTGEHVGIGVLEDVTVDREWVLGAHLFGGYIVNSQTQLTLPIANSNAGQASTTSRTYWEAGLKAVYLINSTWRVTLRVQQTHFSMEPSAPTKLTLVTFGAGAQF